MAGISEDMIRYIAAAAAAAVFAYPFVQPYFRGTIGSLSIVPAKDPMKQKMKDLQALIEMSSRLSVSGSKEATDICNKLIDAILKSQK